MAAEAAEAADERFPTVVSNEREMPADEAMAMAVAHSEEATAAAVEALTFPSDLSDGGDDDDDGDGGDEYYYTVGDDDDDLVNTDSDNDGGKLELAVEKGEVRVDAKTALDLKALLVEWTVQRMRPVLALLRFRSHLKMSSTGMPSGLRTLMRCFLAA